MRKKVLAFGSFDILHLGHILYLEKAKRLGDYLIVVVARDESISMFKHRKPVFDQGERLKIIGSLRFVDKVVLGNRLSRPADKYDIIKKYKPTVIALGYDQRVNAKALMKWLAGNRINAKVVRLKYKINTKVYKSSRLRGIIEKEFV